MGDVFLSCSGSIGRTCHLAEQGDFAMVRSVAIIRPSNQLNGKLLELSLRSPFLQRQIAGRVLQTAQGNLFQGEIRRLRVPVPPLSSQKRFLSIITELDQNSSSLKQRKLKLQSMRKAILAILSLRRISV